MPIKLLIVTSKSAGGSGKHIEMLAKGLSKEDISIDLIYFKHGYDQDPLIEQHFNKVHIFPSKLGFNFGLLINVVYLIKLISKNQYSIVHSHTSLGGAIARIATFFFIKRKFKTIHTVHAYGADEYTRQPWWLIFFIIEKIFDLVTDRYITPSKFTANYGIKIKLFKREKVKIIYNSLNQPDNVSITGGSIRSDLKIKNNDLMFLFCGRLEEQKGLFVLLAAWKIFVVKNKNCKLVIVGQGSQEQNLKSFVKTNHLNDSIVFTGWSNEVDKYYASANVFVMTSIWESFGLVFLDAMRHKLPIIASDTQGIPEVVKNGITGLLCPVNDPLEIVQNLNKLARDKNLRHQLGKEGYKRLQKKFTYNKFIAEHLKLYKKIVKGI